MLKSDIQEIATTSSNRTNIPGLKLLDLLQNNLPEDLNSEDTENFENLILRNLIYTSLKSYKEFVSLLSIQMQMLPDSFVNIAEYQLKFRYYIEIAAHLDIQTGWNNLTKGENSFFRLSSVDLRSKHELPESQFEFSVGIEFDKEELDESLKSHLHQSIILLKNDSYPNFPLLCLSDSRRSSKSNILYLRFRCSAEDQEKFKQLFSDSSNKWRAGYVTSLIDLTRSYVATLSFADNECLQQIVTGNIQLSPLPKNFSPINTDEFLLNNEQSLMVQHALQGSDKVNILYGPPGTGKTKTLAALINLATRYNLRVVVTAPSNQALSELAVRLLESGTKIVLIGDKSKLSDKLEIAIHSGWTKRLANSLITLSSLSYQITQYFSIENTMEIPDYDLLAPDFDQFITELINFLKQLSMSQLLMEKLSKLEHTSKVKYSLKRYKDEFVKIHTSKEELLTLRYWLNQLNNDLAILKIKLLPNKEDRHIENELLEQSGTAFFATPSTLGRIYFRRKIDIVVFDEAGQAPEVECLPALAINPKKMILAGDPKQLNKLCLLQDVKKCKYDRSLLNRLILDLKLDTIFLKTQYRMPKQLSDFISSTFYNGELETAHDIKELNHVIDINGYTIHMAFIDIVATSTQIKTGYQNLEEAKLIGRFVRLIKQQHPEASIGVIAFYVKQAKLIKQFLPDEKDVLISSVDKFQGGERNFIIISGTRSEGVGFLKDLARINVALSRASGSVFMFGHKDNLSQVESIRKFVQYIEKQKSYYTQESFNNWLTLEESKIHHTKTSSLVDVGEDKIQSNFFDVNWAEKIITLLADDDYLDFSQPIEEITKNIEILEENQKTIKSKITLTDEESLQQEERLALVNSDNYIDSQLEQKRQEYILSLDAVKQEGTKKIQELKSKILELENAINLKSLNNNILYIEQLLYFKKQQVQLYMYNNPRLISNFTLDNETYQNLLDIAIYTSDNILRCAIFCRLSYYSFVGQEYWGALFFALQIDFFMHHETDNAKRKYYIVYQDALEKIKDFCKHSLFSSFDDYNLNSWTILYDELDENIVDDSKEVSLDKIYEKIVLCFLRLEKGPFKIKLDALDELMQLYLYLDYAHGFGFIHSEFMKLEQELLYAEKCNLLGSGERIRLRELLLDYDKNIVYFNNKSKDFDLEAIEAKDITIANISYKNIDLHNQRDSISKIKIMCEYLSIITKLENNSVFNEKYLFVCYEIFLLEAKYNVEKINGFAEQMKLGQIIFNGGFDNHFLKSWILYQIDTTLSKSILKKANGSAIYYDPEVIFEPLYLNLEDFIKNSKPKSFFKQNSEANRLGLFNQKTQESKLPASNHNDENTTDLRI